MEKQQTFSACGRGSNFSAEKTKIPKKRKASGHHQTEWEVSSNGLLPLFDEYPSWVKKPKTSSSKISFSFASSKPGRVLKELRLFGDNRVTNNSVTLSSVNKESGQELDSSEDLQEKGFSNVSTQLILRHEDPFNIKKKITASDVGQLSRLMLPSELAIKHILPFLNANDIKLVEKEGATIKIWDMNTTTEHELVFKRWNTSRCYVLNGSWTKDFVQRRELKKDDLIGLYWDLHYSRLNFCVLSQANQD